MMNYFDNVVIGKRIKSARKAANLSQTELAKRLDKTMRTIQKYESGQIEVSLSVMNQLAEALDITVLDILGCNIDSDALLSGENQKNLGAVECVEKAFLLKKIAEIQNLHPYNGTERDMGIYDVCACLSAFVELMPIMMCEGNGSVEKH